MVYRMVREADEPWFYSCVTVSGMLRGRCAQVQVLGRYDDRCVTAQAPRGTGRIQRCDALYRRHAFIMFNALASAYVTA